MTRALSCLVAIMVLGALPLEAAFSLARTNEFEWAADFSAIIQYNGTAMSKMTPVSSLARFSFEYSPLPGLALGGRAYASSGRNRLHRTPGALATINQVAATPNETAISNGNSWPVRLDELGLRLRGEHYALTIALADPLRAWGDDDGIMQNPLANDLGHGFVNGHFVRNLAINWTEKEFFRSVPLVAARFRLDDWLGIKLGISFGDSEYHFFIRNTGFLEIDFSWNLAGAPGRLSLGLGASDADKSNTHKLSPSAGAWLSQALGAGLAIFGQISHAEEANRVSTLFGTCHWHLSGGMVFETANRVHRFGLGVSTARFYSTAYNEKAAEIFWRLKLFAEAFLTFDLAVLKNPAGTALEGEAWVVLPALQFNLGL